MTDLTREELRALLLACYKDGVFILTEALDKLESGYEITQKDDHGDSTEESY